MNEVKTKLLCLLKDEEGQSTTEYILILAVVVMIALKFKSKFTGVMDQMVNDLDGKLQQGLE